MKRFKISKWIFLSLAILINIFLIYESCLEGESSSLHSEWFTNIIVNTINSNKSHTEVENIPLQSIFFTKQDAEVNNDNVVLGTTSTYKVSYHPQDASNKNIRFVSNSNSINVVQANNVIRVEGLSLENDISLTAYSLENESIFTNIKLNVVDRNAPDKFSISINNKNECSIIKGHSQLIDVNIDGYDSQNKARLFYNPNLIEYHSSNESVAIVQNGYIKSIGVGEAVVSATNATNSIKVVVNENPNPINNSITSDDWSIVGYSEAHTHDFDYIDDENYSFYTQLSVDFGSNDLTDQNIYWSSSDETIARVDNLGRVYGHKKSGEVIISATSIADSNKTKSFKMNVNDVLPTNMNVNFNNIDSLEVGKSLSFSVSFEPINATNKNIIVESMNNSVLEATSSGWNANVRAISVGSASIKITSIANSDLSITKQFSVTPIQAISNEEKDEIGYFIRKSLGHFLAFGVSGVLVTITLYMFLADKFKKYILIIMSTLIGIFVASLTEFIQLFVPGRSGTLIDILIDLGGYVLFGAILIGIYYLVIFINRKKSKPRIIK